VLVREDIKVHFDVFKSRLNFSSCVHGCVTHLEKLYHLIEEWDNIPLETIQKLYDSIPRRIEVILKANGGPISY